MNKWFFISASLLCLAVSDAGLTRAMAVDERLVIISEQTGLVASDKSDSSDCEYSAEFGVYLCPHASAGQALTAAAGDRSASTATLDALAGDGVLFIPDSTNKRIMSFDPFTGAQIDSAFITLDDVATGTAIHALMRPNGTILVSDQTRDVVHQYNLDGDYQGVFAPAGGADTSIMDNIRGMALRPNGNLLVTVGASANANSVAEFDLTGQHVGNFIANNSGGLDSPYDVYQRSGGDWLVSSINSDEILRFGGDGVALGQFAQALSFPQQIVDLANGNVLVSNFSGSETGVLEFQANGDLVDRYNPGGLSEYRGIYELGNGNLLVSTSGGVYEINRSEVIINTHHTGQSRFIQFAKLGPPLELEYTVGPFVDHDTCPTETETSIAAGQSAAYCYRVRNNSTVTWTRHDLEDSEWGVLLDAVPVTLSPGASVFLNDERSPAESVTSEATWTAYNPGPIDEATATGSVTVNVVPPSIELQMTLRRDHDPNECGTYESLSVVEGTHVGVCYRVTNTGLTTLSRHDLEDSVLGSMLDGFPLDLGPGAHVFVSLGHTISEDTVFSATWTAYNPGPEDLVDSTNSVTVLVDTDIFQDRFESQ
jgi:hypothetical protein